MEAEKFEFTGKHERLTYTVQVKRFLMEGEVHLWVLVRQPGVTEQVFNFYETDSPDHLRWHSLNDKRDELLSALEKPLLSKLKELKKKGKIQVYEFYD